MTARRKSTWPRVPQHSGSAGTSIGPAFMISEDVRERFGAVAWDVTTENLHATDTLTVTVLRGTFTTAVKTDTVSALGSSHIIVGAPAAGGSLKVQVTSAAGALPYRIEAYPILPGGMFIP